MTALVTGLLWLGLFAIPMLIVVILRRLGRKHGLDDRYNTRTPSAGARLPKVAMSRPMASTGTASLDQPSAGGSSIGVNPMGLFALMGWGPAPRGRGRRYGHGRPGRRVRGFYRARRPSRGGRRTGPIPLGGPGGCLPSVLAILAGVAWIRRRH